MPRTKNPTLQKESNKNHKTPKPSTEGLRGRIENFPSPIETGNNTLSLSFSQIPDSVFLSQVENTPSLPPSKPRKRHSKKKNILDQSLLPSSNISLAFHSGTTKENTVTAPVPNPLNHIHASNQEITFQEPVVPQPSLSSSSTSSSLTRYLSAPLDSSLKDLYSSPQPILPSLSKITKSSNNLRNLSSTSNLPLHHSNLLMNSVVTPVPYHSSFLSPSSNSGGPSFFQSSGPFPKHISFSTISSQSDFGSNINTTVIQFIDNLYNTYISIPIVFQVLYDSNLLHPNTSVVVPKEQSKNLFLENTQYSTKACNSNTYRQNNETSTILPFLSSIQSFDSDIKLQIIQKQLGIFQSFGFNQLTSLLSSKQTLYSNTVLSTRLQNIYFNLCSLFQCIKFPGIQQRSQDWYNIRKSMITASEFGTALGCGAYTTQEQFIQKKIFPNTSIQSPQFILDWGIMFEPVLNLIYQIKNNTIVFDFGFLVHKNYPFFGASPDGITSEGVMVEFKAPFRRKLSDSFPMQYYYQVQGQLDVCNLLECDYVEAKFDPIIYDYQDFLFTIFGLNYGLSDDDDDNDHQLNPTIQESPKAPLSDQPTNPDIFFGAIVQFSQDNRKSYKYSSINPTIQYLNHFISSNTQLFQSQGFYLYDRDTKYDPTNPTPTFLFKFWILHQSNYQSFRIFKNSPFFHSEINKAYSIHTHILQQKQQQ